LAPAQILLVSLGGTPSGRIADPLVARGLGVQAAGGITAASRLLDGRDLVIVDAGNAAQAADACRRLRKSAGRALPILVVTASGSIDDRILVLESGADDVLDHGFDNRELEALIDALLARSRPSTEGEGSSASELPSRPGRVIVFGAAKGGAGTTTLAVNAALLLAQAGGKVAIADMDLHHGQVATHLDVITSHSTAHLSRDEHVVDNPLLVRQAAVRHESGLSVFPAPSRPDGAALVTVDDVIALVGTMRQAFETIVVDAGSVAGSRAMAMIAIADRSFVVVTPDIPGLRAVQGAMEAMADAGVLGEQTSYLLNEPHAHGAIEQPDIERHLHVEVSLRVPHDGENCMRAVNEGKPISLLAPRSPVTAALRRLVELIEGREAVEADGAAAERRRGRLGGLLRRG
jgi:pilus assembly protein CpaE